ncbi:MAG: GntR family transcriptional regulator [Gammaproteobacteria bacterium]|nr:GntR family transcriptional regulator [Gammaproteobacteria bacterium]
MSLADVAYASVKSDILHNRLAPGSQMLESEVERHLLMSRTPVREALIRLQGDGLIELIPRRGVRIVPLSQVDMREIYEILTVLEPEVAAGVAKASPNSDQLAGLEKATADMENALAHENLDAWADADDRFHRNLLDLHGNARLIDFLNTLFDQAYRARIFTLRMREIPESSTREHREILGYIASGDAQGARSAFHAHRVRAATELLALLEKTGLDRL